MVIRSYKPEDYGKVHELLSKINKVKPPIEESELTVKPTVL
jgi:hypothetical protein